MGGLVRYLQLKAQAKVGLSTGVMIFAVVALICVVTAVVFLIFAAFIWLAEHYSPLTAALILCGFFLLLAILAGIGSLMSHRGTITAAESELAKRATSPLLDPKLLGLGLQLGRSLGWRRLVPLLAVGVIAAALGREWFGRDQSDADGADEDEDDASDE